MLRTEGLQYKYQTARSITFPDLKLSGHTLLLGASGSGKTTLLHLLAGLLPVQEGSIWFDQTDISKLSESKRDQFRGQHIGLVFQQSHFVKGLSVEDNLKLAPFFAQKKEVSATRAKELLNSLGLGEKATREAHQLSQGEQQRAAIARALMNSPKLILADEPTASLDDKNTAEVAELLLTQAEQTGAILLIVTHDQRLRSLFKNCVLL